MIRFVIYSCFWPPTASIVLRPLPINNLVYLTIYFISRLYCRIVGRRDQSTGHTKKHSWAFPPFSCPENEPVTVIWRTLQITKMPSSRHQLLCPLCLWLLRDPEDFRAFPQTLPAHAFDSQPCRADGIFPRENSCKSESCAHRKIPPATFLISTGQPGGWHQYYIASQKRGIGWNLAPEVTPG